MPSSPMSFLRRSAGVGVALLLTAGFAAPAAQAQDTPKLPTKGVPAAQPKPGSDASIDEKRAWCRFEIERRLIKIDLLNAQLATSKSVTPSNRHRLDAMLRASQTAMIELDAALQSIGDPVAIDQTCKKVETQHLVFSLRTPQLQNVVTADGVVRVAGILGQVAADLGPSVDAAAAKGNPHTARMRELLADGEALSAGAATRVNGLADAMMVLTPADWRANRDVIVPYQQRNRASRADLVKARADITEVIELLKWQPDNPVTS